MTEEEVNLIYDYLHENYEYRDGELVRIKGPRGVKIGKPGGTFTHINKANKAIIQITIPLNGKRFAFSGQRLIYLYHYRRMPQVIKYRDENIMNHKIENLYESDHIGSMNHKEFKGYTFANNSYKVRAMVDGKKLHFGAYHDEETAKEIYLLIKKLWIEDRLTGIQIKKIIQEKYFHKKSRYIETKGYRLIKGKYVTRATINGQRKHIGTFKTPEEAHAAYLKAKEEYKK